MTEHNHRRRCSKSPIVESIYRSKKNTDVQPDVWAQRSEEERGRAGHTAFCGVMQVLLGPQARGGKQESGSVQPSPLLRPAHLKEKLEAKTTERRNNNKYKLKEIPLSDAKRNCLSIPPIRARYNINPFSVCISTLRVDFAWSSGAGNHVSGEHRCRREECSWYHT